MMKKPQFITIEGLEGAGKSTAIATIEATLSQSNIPYVLTREPGGTELGERVREILLASYHEKVDPTAELLLVFSARQQHIKRVILPALEQNQWVISDRYIDASFAYQGGGRGIPFEKIDQLVNWTQCPIPNKTLFLDIDIDIGMSRVGKRGERDRFEKEDVAFFERVRDAYLHRMQLDAERFIRIDAAQAIDTVSYSVTEAIQQIVGEAEL